MLKLEDFLKTPDDTGLLGVVVKMEEKVAGGGLGPFQPFHPVGAGKEMGPEGLPVGALWGGAVVVRGVGFDQNHIAGTGQKLAVGMPESRVAAEVVNEHPVAGAVGAVGIETGTLAVGAGHEVAGTGGRGFGAGLHKRIL